MWAMERRVWRAHDHTVVAPRPALAISTALLALSFAVGACGERVTQAWSSPGCEFHCETSLCGPPVAMTTHQLPACVSYEAGGNPACGPGSNASLPETLVLVDLRSRNISRVMQGGLACYGHNNSIVTHGVTLDNNPLVAPLNRTEAGMSGAQYVSMVNCSLYAVGEEDFDMTTTVLFVELSHNNIQAVPLLRSPIEGALYIQMAYNPITELPPRMVATYFNHLFLGLSHCDIQSIPNYLLQSSMGNSLYMNFSYNRIQSVETPLAGLTVNTVISIDFGSNEIESVGRLFVPSERMNVQTHFEGTVSVLLGNNSISTAPEFIDMFVFCASLYVELKGNNLADIDGAFLPPRTMWPDCPSRGSYELDVSYNPLTSLHANLFADDMPDADPIDTVFSMDLNGFDIDDDLFNHSSTFMGNRSTFPFHEVSLNVSYTTTEDPLLFPDRFYTGSNDTIAPTGTSIIVDASATNAPLTALQSFAYLNGLRGMVADGDCGLVCNVYITWSRNGVVSIPPNGLWGVTANSLDFSFNGMTTISAFAFEYAPGLVALDLSNNYLTVYPEGLSQTAMLATISVNNNNIQAAPQYWSHIDWNSAGTTNPLRCRANAMSHSDVSNCACALPYNMSTMFGYIRCTRTPPSGCPLNTVLNASDQSLAPWSVCVTSAPPGYYSAPDGTIRKLTNCSTVYRGSRGSSQQGLMSFLPAYQFTAPTWTTDRVCAPCTTCKAGFSAIPCTPTTDTVCTHDCSTAFPNPDGQGYRKAYQLAPATSSTDAECSVCTVCAQGLTTAPCTATTDSSCVLRMPADDTGMQSTAVVLAAALSIIVVGFVIVLLVRRRHREAMRSEHDVILSRAIKMDNPLCLITYPRCHEDGRGDGGGRDVMANAHASAVALPRRNDVSVDAVSNTVWSWDCTQLTHRRETERSVLGREYSAYFGSKPVAIKVYVDESGSVHQSTSLERDLLLIQKIEHKNLVTLLGCGMEGSHDVCLVTERVEGTTLATVLQDSNRDFPWVERVPIAMDVGSALKYLHAQGLYHGDVRASAVVVMKDGHAKLDDAATNRVCARLSLVSQPNGRRDSSESTDVAPTMLPNPNPNPDRNTNPDHNPTLGTRWPWMAPELLSCRHGDVTHTMATDTYAFGIVLWELWARQLPWAGLTDKYADADVVSEHQREIINGYRPPVPDQACMAPSGYRRIMHDCWHTDPLQRPSLDAVVHRLANIRQRLLRTRALRHGSGSSIVDSITEHVLPGASRGRRTDIYEDETNTASDFSVCEQTL